MAEEIRADYEELEQVASRFTNQCAQVQQMLQKVRGSMEKLEDGGWIGRGSDAFFNEMNGEVLPATERLLQALDPALSQRLCQELNHRRRVAAFQRDSAAPQPS